MPKQIPNLKENILSQAREILLTQGYRAMSMRTVAARCGVASGTLYNYYLGKEALVAAITLEDWQACLANMNALMPGDGNAAATLCRMCGELCAFVERYRQVWAQCGSGGRMSAYGQRYHRVLRTQLSEPVRGVLPKEDARLIDALTEAMLACAMSEDLGADAFGLLASKLTLDG